LDIRYRFGERVADIVYGCSDTVVAPGQQKEDWHIRKQRYIDHLRRVDTDTLLVSLCDKAHNARSILRDLRACLKSPDREPFSIPTADAQLRRRGFSLCPN
jgi:(p)ppGpp synthase/HD superfamily hydrolase